MGRHASEEDPGVRSGSSQLREEGEAQLHGLVGGFRGLGEYASAAGLGCCFNGRLSGVSARHGAVQEPVNVGCCGVEAPMSFRAMFILTPSYNGFFQLLTFSIVFCNFSMTIC